MTLKKTITLSKGFFVNLYFGLSYVVIGLLPKTHATKVIPIIDDINIVG